MQYLQHDGATMTLFDYNTQLYGLHRLWFLFAGHSAQQTIEYRLQQLQKAYKENIDYQKMISNDGSTWNAITQQWNRPPIT